MGVSKPDTGLFWAGFLTKNFPLLFFICFWFAFNRTRPWPKFLQMTGALRLMVALMGLWSAMILDDKSDDSDLEATFNEARRLRLDTEARNQLALANAEGAASTIVRVPDHIMAGISGTAVVSRDHSSSCPTSCAEACCRQVARHPETYHENAATVSVYFLN